jgi:predicted site-specific integrase-resolvase
MFYTRAEAIEILQVTPPTLYLFISQGKLTKYKKANGLVFFEKEQVDKLASDRNSLKVIK